MKSINLLTILICFSLNSLAQGIKGIITDEKKQPISFATIYIESLQTGTMANLDGVYEIALKPGNYKVIFRSLGYKPVTKEIEVQNTSVTLNVTLLTQSYLMKEVIITPGTEDLAYSIMRKVIAWSNYHLNQVQHYQSEVYLKGTLGFEKVPKLLEKLVKANADGSDIKFKSGQTYVSESMNEILFDAPSKYTQKVKSQKSSFPEDGNNQRSPMSYITASFYAPNILECISPLSPQAFSHYKFVYEGFSKEGDQIIDKIKVIPRRKSQQLFSGYIYIVEQYWCLYSVDLSNEQFWGKIKINQLFTSLKNEVWLPVSHNYYINASILGVNANYKYIATVKYSDIKINEQIKGPTLVKKEVLPIVETHEKGKSKKEEELEQLLAKDKLSYRDMRKIVKATREEEKKAKLDTAKSYELKKVQNYVIKDEVVKRDTSYWALYRPVPLTVEEIKSYHEKDSLILRNNTAASKDNIKSKNKNELVLSIGSKASKDTTSSKKRSKKLKLLNEVLFGYSWLIKNPSVEVKYHGLLYPEYFSFNTVDGWVYNQGLTVSWNIDSVHRLSLSPKVGYAFNRKVWTGNIDGLFKYAPLSRGQFIFAAGSSSSDFNQESGMNKHINTIASLFFRRNYMKLFENRYINLKNEIDLANGLQLTTSAKYFESAYLGNHSDYSFFYRGTREYTTNVPDNDYFLQVPDNHYKSFAVSLGLNYTPEYYYRIVKGSKRMEQSKYPTFILNYSRGLSGVLGSNSSYHHIYGAIDHNISLRNRSSLDYVLTYGTFFDVDQIHFSEYKHFNTQFLPVMVGGFEKSFQLLDYYKYSTSDQYLEGHLHYKTRLLLLKRLPLISNRIWSENIYLNFLTTPSLNNYAELGYSLGNIAGLGNLGVFASFENWKYQSVGVKVSIGIEK